MLVEIVEKQRRAVSVVKTALLAAGINNRRVAAGFDIWTYQTARVVTCAVFVSAPEGANIEPFYESGKSFVEAVRKLLATIKGQANENGANPSDQTGEAPF